MTLEVSSDCLDRREMTSELSEAARQEGSTSNFGQKEPQPDSDDEESLSETVRATYPRSAVVADHDLQVVDIHGIGPELLELGHSISSLAIQFSDSGS